MAAPDIFSLARHNRYEALKQLLVDNAIDVNECDAKGNTMLLVAPHPPLLAKC